MTPALNTIYLGDNIATMRTWPDSFVQTCVTSPPYFGLRDYGVEGQLGLEKTPEEFVAKLVDVFREVRRVLRDDGTLWVNMGDSYCASGGHTTMGSTSVRLSRSNVAEQMKMKGAKPSGDIKTKDLIGVPWMLAFALRADGWYLRSDIIWAKKNCMPESVTDRPTKAHEYFFLLSKSPDYYYDAEAIKEKSVSVSVSVSGNGFKRDARESMKNEDGSPRGSDAPWTDVGGTRNKRSVWHVGTKPFAEAHFATFPPDLIYPCVLAGTSEKGCCAKCGAPLERDVERVPATSKECPKTQASHEARGGTGKPKGTVGKSGSGRVDGYTNTLGWKATCSCQDSPPPVPCVVLDPFMGAGTTALVAATYSRAFIGCELNPAYKAIADARIAGEVAQDKFL